jgi:hypothetical protein
MYMYVSAKFRVRVGVFKEKMTHNLVPTAPRESGRRDDSDSPTTERT